jgi:hypothetical protein
MIVIHQNVSPTAGTFSHTLFRAPLLPHDPSQLPEKNSFSLSTKLKKKEFVNTN